MAIFELQSLKCKSLVSEGFCSIQSVDLPKINANMNFTRCFYPESVKKALNDNGVPWFIYSQMFWKL